VKLRIHGRLKTVKLAMRLYLSRLTPSDWVAIPDLPLVSSARRCEFCSSVPQPHYHRSIPVTSSPLRYTIYCLQPPPPKLIHSLIYCILAEAGSQRLQPITPYQLHHKFHRTLLHVGSHCSTTPCHAFLPPSCTDLIYLR
jgi:hypothetical protein